MRPVRQACARFPARPFALACALLLTGGCTTAPMERSVVAHEGLSPATTTRALRCGYRLEGVVDRRHDGDAAGGIGRSAFAIEDAETLVQGRLGRLGFTADPTAPRVHVEIRQLYLAQNLTTKIPVAVYRVAVGHDAPRIMRSRAASMTWNGSREEGLRALARALDDADAQLVASLNARCG